MISQPSRHCTVELQALPSRIGQVRRIISAQLRYWHLDSLIDHAALGVTELLTNVHRHAQPDKLCRVELKLLRGVLRVSVRDHDPRLPVPHGGVGTGLGSRADVDTGGAAGVEGRGGTRGRGDADPFATSGRGLALIEAMSESWGARPDGEDGKVVWFTLAAPPPPPLAAAHPALYGAPADGPFAAEEDRPGRRGPSTARSAVAG
ncbi:ATP-binding protein [Streptomyces sp. MUM 178J]|uniref:ATP-binding protein n=1 Tax=Streptomyces sp. MUM 178J TaxID=2791991 RepID=UPI001F04F715|nr:ATP-binding protein [Streptomyces sp. MUM 178J]WRQ78200.1 ATP-binding protein [Streptomyces sp. MUM 178J]